MLLNLVPKLSMIWFHLDCIMQLKESCYIATNVCSRKSVTTFGDLPDCLSLVFSPPPPPTPSSHSNHPLTHWGQVTHICVSNLTIIGSDNGLSPGQRPAIIWTNAGILLIGPLGTKFSEILIGIQPFYSRNCIWKRRLQNGVYFSRPQWVTTKHVVGWEFVFLNTLRPRQDCRHLQTTFSNAFFYESKYINYD